MKLHEHQGKELFRKAGVPVPLGRVAFDVDEAEAAGKAIVAETGDETVVVKAQIHAGGRGKGGGVQVVKGVAAAREAGEATKVAGGGRNGVMRFPAVLAASLVGLAAPSAPAADPDADPSNYRSVVPTLAPGDAGGEFPRLVRCACDRRFSHASPSAELMR